MTRSTLLYLGMLVLLSVGFEGIRRVGNTLTPPPHIAGQWSLSAPSSSSSCPLLEFVEAGKESVQVEQSGRYLMLTFSDIHHTQLHARLNDRQLHGSGPSQVTCAEGKWLYLTGRLHGGSLEIVLTPSQEMSSSAAPTLVLLATQSPLVATRTPSSASHPLASP